MEQVSGIKSNATTLHPEEDIREAGPLRRPRRLFASLPYLVRLSMAREVLREIRNLGWRIGTIQCRNLDRQGVEIPRLGELVAPDLRESALKQCMKDTQSLCASPRLSSLIDAELVSQSWNRGAMWALHNSHTSLRE
jgi:hypothetical protein